jgi:hypothetical protein
VRSIHASRAERRHELAAAERDGGNGRASGHTTGDRPADMRLGAMQQLGDFGKREQIELTQAIHKKSSAARAGSYTPGTLTRAVSHHAISKEACRGVGFLSYSPDKIVPNPRHRPP